MLILPLHRNSDHESRISSLVILVRLGFIFVFLLAAISFVFYASTSALACSFPLSSVLTAIQTLSTPLFGYSFSPVPCVQHESDYGWDTIRPGEHCLRYSTRQYTSRLLQLHGPYNSSEAMKACREIPAELHGRLLKSNWCQDLGFGRGIYGFWTISFDEPECETHWGEFNDLGCSGNSENISLRRRAVPERTTVRHIESRLENLQSGSNWQIMCVTTPAEIHGRRYASPTSCLYDIKQGVLGKWDVEDLACRN